MEVSVRFLGSLCFAATKPYLSLNSILLSYKMREDEEASSFKLTMDRGLYHGGYVVGSISKFSGSSFFSMSMMT